MSNRNAFTNLPAVLAADARAARFLLAPHEAPEDRAAASAEAVQLLDQAVRACIRAGRDDAAHLAADAQAALVGQG